MKIELEQYSRRVRQRADGAVQPTTLQELENSLQEEWNNIPIALTNYIIRPMRRRPADLQTVKYSPVTWPNRILKLGTDKIMEGRVDYNILDLPPCVLLHIYSFLNPEDILSMRNICQIWHHVSFNSSIWKTLDTRTCGDTFVTDGSFCALLHEVENTIECLHFDIRFIAILEYLIEGDDVLCHNLSKMYIYNETKLGSKWNNSDSMPIGLSKKMAKLSQKYKQLKTLWYSDLFINTDAVFSGLEEFECNCSLEEERPPLEKFLKRHPQLRDIRIQFYFNYSEDIFSSLFTDFPHLKKLCIYEIPSADLSPQLQHRYHLSQLQSLNMDSLDITDKTFEVIFKNASDLRKFEVSECNRFTDITLECLAKYCHKLESLRVTGGKRNYTDAGLITVATNCPELKEVQISQFVDSQDLTILSFISHCPQLRVLDVGGAPNLTDNTLLTMIERCPNIRRLYLSSCQNLTALSISAVLRYYKHLDYLSIAYNKTLTSFDLVEAKSEEPANIQHLEKKEVNKSMTQSVERWSALKTLDMSGCSAVTDSCLYNIACYCSNFRELYLSRCENLTDITVQMYVKRCPFLQILDISVDEDNDINEKERKITDDSLVEIAKYCKNLERLGVENRDYITAKGISEVMITCPVLRFVNLEVNNEKSDITTYQLIDIAERCKHRFVGIFRHYATLTHSNFEIELCKFKPTSPQGWLYCNYDGY